MRKGTVEAMTALTMRGMLLGDVRPEASDGFRGAAVERAGEGRGRESHGLEAKARYSEGLVTGWK